MYEANWKAFAESQKLTSRTCGKGELNWVNRSWKWIADKYKDESMFVLKEDFITTKCFANLLTKLGWYRDFTSFLGTNVNFKKKTLQNSVAIANMHCFLTTLNEHFHGSMDINDIKLIFFEGIRFFVPVTIGKARVIDDNGGESPESVDSGSAADSPRTDSVFFQKRMTDVIKLLTTQMTEHSPVYLRAFKVNKPQPKPKAKKVKPEKPPKDGKDPKKEKDKKEKDKKDKENKANKKPASLSMPMETLTHGPIVVHDVSSMVAKSDDDDDDADDDDYAITDGEDAAEKQQKTRPLYWLDDLMIALRSPFSAVPGATDGVKITILKALVPVGLEFCFYGEVTIKDTKYTAWSSARAVMKSIVLDALGGASLSFATPSTDSPETKQSPAAIVSSRLMTALTAGCNSPNNTASSSSSPSSIASPPKSDGSVHGTDHAEQFVQTLIKNDSSNELSKEKFCENFGLFLSSNCKSTGVPLRVMPVYQTIIAAMWNDAPTTFLKTVKTDFRCILEGMIMCTAKHVFKEINSTWYGFGVAVLADIKISAKYPDFVKHLCKCDASTLDPFMKLRAQVTHLVLTEMIGDSGPLTLALGAATAENDAEKKLIKTVQKKSVLLSKFLGFNETQTLLQELDFALASVSMTAQSNGSMEARHKEEKKVWAQVLLDIFDNMASGTYSDEDVNTVRLIFQGTRAKFDLNPHCLSPKTCNEANKLSNSNSDVQVVNQNQGNVETDSILRKRKLEWSLYDTMAFVDMESLPQGTTVELPAGMRELPHIEVPFKFFNTGLLRMICANIEVVLYQMAFGNITATLQNIKTDILSKDADRELVTTRGLDDLVLAFAGPVSTTRVSRSHPVCCVSCNRIKIPIYVQGDKLQSFGSASESNVPAWLVPVVTDEDSATMLVDTVTTKVKMPKQLVPDETDDIVATASAEPSSENVDGVDDSVAKLPDEFEIKAPILRIKPMMKGRMHLQLTRTSVGDEMPPKSKRIKAAVTSGNTVMTCSDILDIIGISGSMRAEERKRKLFSDESDEVLVASAATTKYKTKANQHLLK